MARRTGELAAAQRWLDAHSSSPHTRRKYDTQLQQLCEWLVLRDRTLLNSDGSDLQAYLTALARGELSAAEGTRGPRLRATVIQARSVLSGLFEFLVHEGLRRSNPIGATTIPVDDERFEPLHPPDQERPSIRWLNIRAAAIERARDDEAPRSPLRRAVAIAELACWCGLRRSELATATMDNFVQMQSQWWIRMPRFGHGDEDLIEVPRPAMYAVSLYRQSRQLPALPGEAEKGVPLIAAARSETPVNAWSIANALKDLLLATQDVSSDSRPQAIVALRREVASEGLKAKIAAHQLARHLRSSTLIDQVAKELARETVGPALERLAA